MNEHASYILILCYFVFPDVWVERKTLNPNGTADVHR